MLKKFILVFTSLLLLLFAEAICLVSSNASEVSPHLKLNSIGFYYKKDANPRFLHLKTQWQAANRSELSYGVASKLALKAYQQSSVEAPLSVWRYDSGPSPNIITSKAHLYNPTQQAWLNVPIHVTVQAKVANLNVTPSTQMTDLSEMKTSAYWLTLSDKTINIPAIAPAEDLLLPVMQFSLMDFKTQYPRQWPTRLLVHVNGKSIEKGQEEISLIPDYFVMPAVY